MLNIGHPLSKVTDGLKELLEFGAVSSPGYVDDTVNETRGFRNSCTNKRSQPLARCLKRFSASIFLLEHRDRQFSCAGKEVTRPAYEIVQEMFDADRQTQEVDWALLDICAPFSAGYFAGLEFPSCGVSGGTL